MRRQSFCWTYLVLAIILLLYGGFSLISNISQQKEPTVLGIVFFAVGAVMLLVFFVLLILSLFQKKQPVERVPDEVEKEVKVEEIEEENNEPVIEKKSTMYSNNSRNYDTEYSPRKIVRTFNGGSAYIKMVGYGPVLRVDNEEILDMRNNTYYRIEGNYVKRSGYGPVFEIQGNQIKQAFGSYLYEISGSNINKVFGGYYASISGGYLQTHDLQEKYEISGSLSLKQQLAVVAILFGAY